MNRAKFLFDNVLVYVGLLSVTEHRGDVRSYFSTFVYERDGLIVNCALKYMDSNFFDQAEAARIAALKRYDILDTLPEQEFDDITLLASEICQTPIALISLIDENRQWFKSRIGLEVPETPRDISFCTHAIESDGLFEVADPLNDERFANNPLVTGYPNIRFYTGAPLIDKAGHCVGTLCVINSQAHQLTPKQKQGLATLARFVVSTLELRKEKRDAELFKNALNEVSTVAILDGDMKFTYVNDKFSRLAGLPAAEILGRNGGEIKLADVTDLKRDEAITTLRTGKVFRSKIKNINKDNVVTWSDLTVIPYLNSHNELTEMLSLRNDITTEVLILERLEEAEKIAKIGNWEFNVLNASRYWSAGLYNIMGSTPAENPSLSLLDYMGPEDKARMTNEIEQLLEDPNYEAKESAEFRVVTGLGVSKFISITIKKRVSAEGALVSLHGTVQDISDRKENERVIEQHYQNMTDLYNNAPCGYHSLDESGVIVEINDTELQWLGYNREEVVGKMHLTAILSPHDRPFFEADYLRVKKLGAVKDMHGVFVRKDGSCFDALASATSVYDRDGSFVLSRQTLYDITDLRKAQKKLEESEHKYKSLVEESSQMTFTTNVEGAFTYVSPRLQQTLGYELEEILGVKFPFIFDQAWRHKVIGFYVKQYEDKVPETTLMFPILKKNGALLWVEQTSILIVEDGVIQGFRCVQYDVTERVKAHEAMAAAAKLAEEAKEMQQNFLAMMSHEIRTPMNGVVGMANLLDTTPLSTRQKVYVGGIKESAANLIRIINDILDVTKIQAGKLVFEETAFDLAKLVSNVVLTLQPAANAKNILIASNIGKEVVTTVIADSVRLNQVLLNLTGNALKFTEKGVIVIDVALKEKRGEAMLLEFKVADTGIGIAPDKLETIFESFTQAESDTTRKYGGTGLGLTIARQIIEQQNGSIEVESEMGRGTTFIFTYHFKLPSVPMEIHEETTAEDSEQPLTGCRVLLVEDNLMNQKVTEFTLETWGAVVTTVDRGGQAIEVLRKAEFDVILMDIQMPEMNGLDATKLIRNELRLTTPIIAMTANAMQGEREKCINAGMNNYLSKPFEPLDLNKMIRALSGSWGPAKPARLISLPHLNKVAHDDIDIVKEVLAIYIAKTPDALVNIRAHIQSGNYKQLYFEVHNLKNSVSLLGNDELFQQLVAIEEQIYDRQPAEETVAALNKAMDTITLSLEEAKLLFEEI